MARISKKKSPTYRELITPTFNALKKLGGSGTNDEIYSTVIKLMSLTDEVVDEPHLGSTNQSELQYQLAWARTYLKNYGVIVNSSRCVWSITPKFSNVDKLNSLEIIAFTVNRNEHRRKEEKKIEYAQPEDNDNIEFPDEIKPWKRKLSETLQNMDPYAFERLAQRLLRECGFSQVNVTKKSNDGGIDGTGKFKLNGILSFNVAFQCKRYKGAVSVSEIRDFRGALKSDIEKGIFITTGTFTKAAKDEAIDQGKMQIDLIDGEEFISKLVEYELGVKEVKDYIIDEEFFEKI